MSADKEPTLKPEWVRFKTAERIFDLSESYLKGLIREGKIKSRLLKERGQIRGIRLISYDSLNNWIENSDCSPTV